MVGAKARLALRGQAPLRAVYLDTSALIALRDRRDRHHKSAVSTLRELLKEQRTLVAGYHIVVEFLDGVTQIYGQPFAVEELAWLVGSPSLRILPSEAHREAAEDLFRARTAWGIGLSDSLSFALMHHHRLDTAFTYDSDFEKAGFRRVG